MKDSALSVANYFVDKSLNGAKDLKPLKLMKLVYIAHGYMLALLNYSVFNTRFDKVEAWKFGPVIPSVYHSFKRYGNMPIEEKTGGFVDVRLKNEEFVVDYVEPTLNDEEARMICDYVWERYGSYTDSTLVTMLHSPGTPWKDVYVEGQNNIIPDELTKQYYTRISNALFRASQEWKKNMKQ
jgi:uncharacterized phage-associated protein